jgi:uncharacterized damage-inducible protein DinB
MLTRIWHGKTKKEDADIYRQYVIDSGIQDYLNTEGNLDVQIWQRDEEDITHIFAVTQWENLGSIKTFAGDDFEKAKYYSEDKKYLLELEEKVKHYQTYSFSNNQIKNYIKQIEELYKGDNWTDENFLKKLGTLDIEKAFKQPVQGKHSVAEVLWHCIYWRRVLVKRMQGDFELGERTEAEQNFLPLESLKKMGWDNLLAEFKKENELLINFLKSKNDNFLVEENKPGYNNRYMIEGIISHDFYHLGQIGFIISLLNV